MSVSLSNGINHAQGEGMTNLATSIDIALSAFRHYNWVRHLDCSEKKNRKQEADSVQARSYIRSSVQKEGEWGKKDEKDVCKRITFH